MILAFDLDDVLCVREKDKEHYAIGKYDQCVPIQEMIDIVNKLYHDGHYIKIYTARGMTQFGGDVSKVYNYLFDLTVQQLKKWNVRYHELIMGKIHYDLLIDDKAINSLDVESISDILKNTEEEEEVVDDGVYGKTKLSKIADSQLNLMLSLIDFYPKHVVEVGGYSWWRLISRRLITDGAARVDVFEGSEKLAQKLEKDTSPYRNVTIHHAVLAETEGKVNFWEREDQGSSIVNRLSSQPKEVDGYMFSSFDDGTIDFMILDIEWAEFFVLKHMTSRPKIISCEMYEKNPYFEDMENWFKENNYEHVASFGLDNIYLLKGSE